MLAVTRYLYRLHDCEKRGCGTIASNLKSVWDDEQSTRVQKSPGSEITSFACIMAGDMHIRHEVLSIKSMVWNLEQSARVHKSP